MEIASTERDDERRYVDLEFAHRGGRFRRCGSPRLAPQGGRGATTETARTAHAVSPRVATAAALLLVGVLIGGISGGAVATYLASGPAAPLVSQPPAPTSGLPVATAAPASGTALDQVVVGVVRDLLPSVVTVINYASSGQPQGSGSGFVVDAQQGYIISNNHVVEGGAAFDGFSTTKCLGELVVRDPLKYVAVLQGRPGLKPLCARTATMFRALVVVAIGSPLGEFQNTVTQGIVSAKGRRVAESASVVLEDLLQTDAAINPGNSGGPLIWAATHQVVGVNTLVASNATGLGFAVSSNTVRQIA